MKLTILRQNSSYVNLDFVYTMLPKRSLVEFVKLGSTNLADLITHILTWRNKQKNYHTFVACNTMSAITMKNKRLLKF